MKRSIIAFTILFWSSLFVSAQINTDQLMKIGRNALYFEDYVLSIQYFNQVIKAKPFLADPYFYRAVAKLYLEDHAGSEEDCTEALKRNEFLTKAYLCRSYARLKLKKYDEAVIDCDKGLEFDTQNKSLLYNKGFALVSAKRFDEADVCLSEMIRRFPTDVDPYMAKGQMNLERGDTLTSIEDFSRAISVDKYSANGWGARGWVFLMKENYSNALADMNEAIRLKPDNSMYFMNRAVARYHLNDLRGTMEDFDRCIGLDPDSKLSYLNRAILRTTVGDLNRALEDYDKVIMLDPTDYQVYYNRGLVRKDLGKFKEAISDFTVLIEEYPNFIPAYQLRSEAKRSIGDAKGADRDYFAAWNLEEKAREAKASGKKTSTKTGTVDTTTKVIDIKKFNRMIGGNTEEEDRATYEDPIRGKVQDKLAEIELAPMYKLSYYENAQPGPAKKSVDPTALLNGMRWITNKGVPKLLLTNNELALTSKQAETHFSSVNDYSKLIGEAPDNPILFMGRSLDYFLVQDLSNALSDLDRVLAIDSKFVLAYFERSYLRYRKMNVENAGKGTEETSPSAASTTKAPTSKVGTLHIGENVFGADLELVLKDLEQVLKLAPSFYMAYYNRGYIRCLQRDYRNALIDFSKALDLNPDFADAWFNRGITQLYLGDREHGMADLRMAGQLGNYKAYSILKRLGSE